MLCNIPEELRSHTEAETRNQDYVYDADKRVGKLERAKVKDEVD
jgi:hypothetical protein